jgi:autotransporter-associated beta strand protein
VTLTKSGTGKVTLSGSNTYTGLTSVTDGTLALGASNVFADTVSIVINGLAAVLDVGVYTDTVALVTVNLGAVVGSGSLSSPNDFTINVSTGNSVTISSVITGAGGLIKTGLGTVTLSAANTYTGTTAIAAGTLIVGSNAPSGASGALGNATSEILLGDNSGTSSASLLIGGAYTVARSINVRSGNNGTITIGGSTVDSSIFSGNIALNKAATLTATSNGNVTFQTGVISSASSYALTIGATGNTGTVVLSGINTYNGNTNINFGTVSVSAADNYSGATLASGGLGTGSLSFGGGTLQYAGANLSDYSARLLTSGNQLINVHTNA